MIPYWEEIRTWELSEKLLVQMIGSERSNRYKTEDLIKYCNTVAREFVVKRDMAEQQAMEKYKQERDK